MSKESHAAAQRRYQTTDKGRASSQRYYASPKGVLARVRSCLRQNAGRRNAA